MWEHEWLFSVHKILIWEYDFDSVAICVYERLVTIYKINSECNCAFEYILMY